MEVRESHGTASLGLSTGSDFHSWIGRKANATLVS